MNAINPSSNCSSEHHWPNSSILMPYKVSIMGELLEKSVKVSLEPEEMNFEILVISPLENLALNSPALNPVRQINDSWDYFEEVGPWRKDPLSTLASVSTCVAAVGLKPTSALTLKPSFVHQSPTLKEATTSTETGAQEESRGLLPKTGTARHLGDKPSKLYMVSRAEWRQEVDWGTADPMGRLWYQRYSHWHLTLDLEQKLNQTRSLRGQLPCIEHCSRYSTFFKKWKLWARACLFGDYLAGVWRGFNLFSR